MESEHTGFELERKGLEVRTDAERDGKGSIQKQSDKVEGVRSESLEIN